MSPLQFTKLLSMIFSKELPDLHKIEEMGLLAVKIAQHFALRIDFLNPAVCQHLSLLFRSTEYKEGDSAQSLLKHHVKPQWFDNFASIDDHPFASASVGQVHRAQLATGETVVVKVIRHDFQNQFIRDIRRLKRTVSVGLFFVPKLKKVFDPLQILNHIEHYTLNELDLLNEVTGAKRLQELKDEADQDGSLRGLTFPQFYPKLSNANVLVSRFIEGTTFDELLQRRELPYDLLLKVFSLHGHLLFGPGEFHGDLHPGNIILSPQNEIVLVDTAALSTCSPTIRRGLLIFFKELCNENYRGASEAIYTMSTAKLSARNQSHFTSDFLMLYKDFSGKTVSEVSLTQKMMDTIKLGVRWGMSFEEGMFPIIKSLMYLDGMVLRCNPQAHLIRDMAPIRNFGEQ